MAQGHTLDMPDDADRREFMKMGAALLIAALLEGRHRVR
jgi:hypothetical protein